MSLCLAHDLIDNAIWRLHSHNRQACVEYQMDELLVDEHLDWPISVAFDTLRPILHCQLYVAPIVRLTIVLLNHRRPVDLTIGHTEIYAANSWTRNSDRNFTVKMFLLIIEISYLYVWPVTSFRTSICSTIHFADVPELSCAIRNVVKMPKFLCYTQHFVIDISISSIFCSV